jgi:hypothetical protein
MRIDAFLICAASLAAIPACTVDIEGGPAPEADDRDEAGASIASHAVEAGATYRLIRRGSEKCLDLHGNGTADGTNLQQYTCHGGGNQRFRLERLASGAYQLVHPTSGKCVDIYWAGTSNGTNVQLYRCNGTAAQAFQLEHRPGDTWRLRNPHSGKCLDVAGGSSASGANVQIWSCSSGDAQHWRLEKLGGGGGGGGHGAKWADAVVTQYTWQDNSACNSTMTASGRPLVPYVSVALPFRFVRPYGPSNAPFRIGDTIFVRFLQGRVMPDGALHTGWVRIDDFCGDHGSDGYCFQHGKPNVDLYIGDWAHAAVTCVAQNPQQWGSGGFQGPGGRGQEPSEVFFGPAPTGSLVPSYGGRAQGAGRCGDCAFGRTVQPPACWHYDPGSTNIQYCTCSNSNGRHGECP